MGTRENLLRAINEPGRPSPAEETELDRMCAEMARQSAKAYDLAYEFNHSAATPREWAISAGIGLAIIASAIVVLWLSGASA